MEKPTLPKGTRDFGPAVMAKRQFIFNTIRGVFQKFGFQPLETPSMENLSTLTGKYGEEGDQLLFKILNSGDYPEATREAVLEAKLIEDKLRFYFNTLFLSSFNQLKNDSTNEIENINNHINESEQIYFAQVQVIIDNHSNDFKRSIHSLKNASFIEAFNSSNELFTSISKYYLGRIKDDLLDPKNLAKRVSEKGLRYDLTVPFARYVVMNRGEISFPFKRYQIQPVWRADRPQKGRYREFYQCDADVVGTDSLICEAEIILMIKDVFKGLNISDYSIKLNHRGVLSGLAELIGAKGNETSLFVGIDKLDKIGEEKVKEELRLKGFDESGLTLLFEILNFNGSTEQKLEFLTTKFAASQNGLKGISDIKNVLELLKSYGSNDEQVVFDIPLARGLSYYTGCIFEVKINNVSIGSVSGGGRYDNLTQAFGDKENLSGVGFSFGVDRLYDAMEELQIFPKDTQASSNVLICHFDEASQRYGLGVLTALRSAGISSEIYPDQSKIKKQLDYANKKMIPFTIVIGSEEMESGMLAFKDMEKGEQEKLPIDQIVSKLRLS